MAFTASPFSACACADDGRSRPVFREPCEGLVRTGPAPRGGIEGVREVGRGAVPARPAGDGRRGPVRLAVRMTARAGVGDAEARREIGAGHAHRVVSACVDHHVADPLLSFAIPESTSAFRVSGSVPR